MNDPGMTLPMPEGTDQCDRDCLQQFLRTDMDAVAANRRDNYRWLAQRLAQVDGITVLYPLFGDLVPLDFPIIVHDGWREELYFALMGEGLPTIALYYRLIDVITPDAFPNSHVVFRGILNLPVHQDTDRTDLEFLTDRLVDILTGMRS